MSDWHTCDACGGSGDPESCGGLHGMDACAKHYCCRCEMPTAESPAGFCPVCLGAGRISDRMPVADALADAETLLTAFWDEGGGAEWTDAPRGMLINALRASDYGEASIAETTPARGEK